jgi:hypothetical protein
MGVDRVDPSGMGTGSVIAGRSPRATFRLLSVGHASPVVVKTGQLWDEKPFRSDLAATCPRAVLHPPCRGAANKLRATSAADGSHRFTRLAAPVNDYKTAALP